jgi:hypothetical protein
MTYLSSKEIAAVAVTGAVWAIVNSYLGAFFWMAFQLPILCDMIGFSSLIFVTWWTRKLGTASLTGIIATAINFVLNPSSVFFVGFTAASIVFDLVTWFIGYRRLFSKPIYNSVLMVFLAAVAASVAGFIIGPFFMSMKVLQAILIFAGLHAGGGVIGGIIGVALVKALMLRKVIPEQKAN